MISETLKRHSAVFAPLLFLGVCVAAFGLLIPFLGFHWDDWMFLYLAHTQNSFTDFWNAPFRPLHAILDELTYPLFGLNPLPWHLLSLATRWLAVVLAWRVMLRVWPQRREFAAWVAVLFAVYPSFFQQSSAVIYRHHWSSYALFLASLLFMLSEPKERWRRWLTQALGLACMLAGLLITEYMLGLELLRPALLWLMPAADTTGTARRWRGVMARGWPYLGAAIAFIGWRTFGVDAESDPNPPSLIFELAQQPAGTALQLLQAGLQDLVALFWTAWGDILRPETIDLLDRSILFGWAVGLLAALALFYGLRRVAGEDAGEDSGGWTHAARIGLLATLGGLASSWSIGRHMAEGGLSDRFSLPAMLGASLLLCALAFGTLKSMTQRRVLLAFLVAIAVPAHIREANEYRADWVDQARFARQLVLRMPRLEPGTTIVADGAATGTVTRYNAGVFIHLLYEEEVREDLAYWYEEFYTGLHRSVDEFGEGIPIVFEGHVGEFTGNTAESIVLAIDPGETICHWVLGSRDAFNFSLDADFRQIAPFSNWSLIGNPEEELRNPMRALFGVESEPFWCTYYQKADLAAQLEDWESVLDLWAQTQEQDLSAYDGYGYMPFIEGLAATGQWEEAAAVSIRAYNQTTSTQAMLCAAWDRFEMNYPNTDESLAARAELEESFTCP